MTNWMQDGAAWLGDRLQETAGRTITIQQGTRLTESFTATLTTHEHEIIDEHGILLKVLSYDWTIVAEDLTAAGLEATELRTGAIIKETLFGVDYEYEIMPLGQKPAVERLDTSGILLMAHTKQIAILT
jgi:hypothetical protein